MDVMMIREVVNGGRVCHNLHVAEDGGEAMDFLHTRCKYSSAPSSQIMLLDLTLPRKDGREVLTEIKNDPSLRHIPDIILTTSEDQDDLRRSYELQANCFITKPTDMEQFTKAPECLGESWFTPVRLQTPPKP